VGGTMNKINTIFLFCFILSNVVILRTEVPSINIKSEIKISCFAHDGIRMFLKKIDNKKKAISRIDYIAKCEKNVLTVSVLYFVTEGEIIQKKQKSDLKSYLTLWNDLCKIGLSDLKPLPLDASIDPLEFYSALRIDQEVYLMKFETLHKSITFSLYDIKSLKDKRFLAILKRTLSLFGEETIY
jgi:hypothetical protein